MPTDLTDNQKKAIFYKRRAKYKKAFIASNLMPIYEEIRKIETNLQIRFDTREFYKEVNNPNLCIRIER